MPANTDKSHYCDKLSVIQVIAALIKNPLLFSNSDYHFDVNDFPEQFHRIVFGAIEHLAKNGMQKIDEVDIDQFLKQYDIQYKIFCANKGVEYIQQALKRYDESKFDYSYNNLKKYSLLNHFNKQGIDTSDIYNPTLIDPIKSEDMQRRFDEMSVNDIILREETKITLAKEDFGSNNYLEQALAGEGLEELVERLKQTPEMGLPFLSPKLTTIYRGLRKGALYTESSSQGTGKALSNDTKIPTPNGWRTVGDIKVGDYLFDASGKPTKVLDVFPQGLKDVYEIIFKDGRKIQCCEDHLWSYYPASVSSQNRNFSQLVTKSVRQIIDDKQLISGTRRYNILIPINGAVQYPEKTHYLTPYALGLLLGDGSFRDGAIGQHSSKNHAVTFSSSDEELVQSLANEMGWKYRKNSKYNYNWTFKFKNTKSFSSAKYPIHENVWVSDVLREIPGLYNCGSKEKYIPREYLEDSIQHRLDLLNGLLDTDGSISSTQDGKGRISYFTISKQLALDVVELVYSLGFKATLTEDHHKSTNVCYVIRISGSAKNKALLFRLKRKKYSLNKWLKKNTIKKPNDTNAVYQINKLNIQKEMTCFVVDNPEHLFLAGDFIVTHNSRRQAGESAHLAVSDVYNTQTHKWEHIGIEQPVLQISTELELQEVQTMWIAYVSGVDEGHILDGRYTGDEEERVKKAVQIIKNSKLYFVSISNYDIDDIENLIKKYYQIYNVQYVFYDYLSTTLKIMSNGAKQAKISGLREDQVLLMFCTRLKDLAKTLGICIFTATQLSGNWKDAKEADQQLLRGAKSISDKTDCSAILLPVREADKQIIEAACDKGFELEPTHVIHIFKVRRGHYNNIRLYIYFDRSTCHITDLFVTDNNGVILPVADTIIETILNETKETEIDKALPADVFNPEDF